MLAKISGGKGVVQIGSVLISSGGITVVLSTDVTVVATPSLVLETPAAPVIEK